jgi:predicted metal-dependent hydrolase
MTHILWNHILDHVFGAAGKQGLKKGMKSRIQNEYKINVKRKIKIIKRKTRRRSSVSSRAIASRTAYLAQKESTRALVQSRMKYFVDVYASLGIELKPSGRIAIRDSRSRWGSCSSKGNLNFHWKLGVIPVHLSDYIIVHELCHLKEFNHGAGFWNLVAQVCPEYEAYKAELRHIRL